MYPNKVLLMICVEFWSCLMTMTSIVAPKGPLQSYITGGYKGVQARDTISGLNCSQFTSDYEVLYYFPFLIMINPLNNNWQKSTAEMDTNGNQVINLRLMNDGMVPLHVFCLQNLKYLTIDHMSFPNGMVSDDLGNLRQLRQLIVTNSPIVNMTDRLGMLSYLSYLKLQNCSLTYLPNLSKITGLLNIYLSENRLSRVDGLTGVFNLELSNNLFTEIPTLNSPTTLQYLNMDNNPIQNILTITSYINLFSIYLRNTTLSSIPANIDRLQQLQYLYLSNNRLFYLPTNILNLSKLRHLDIRSNSFSSADIQTFKRQFITYRPNITLSID